MDKITRIQSKRTGKEYKLQDLDIQQFVTEAAGHASAAGLAVEAARKAAADTLEEAIRVIGYDDIAVFSDKIDYPENKLVKRLEPDGKYHYYRFTKYHFAGVWSGNDVVETSLYSEIQNVRGTDSERVHLTVTTYDGKSLAGLKISITFKETGEVVQYELDENGYVMFEIGKQKLYTISFPDEVGYRPIPDYSYKAIADDRHLQMEYKDPYTDFETVRVIAIMEDMSGAKVTDSIEMAKLVGQPVTLTIDGESRSYSEILDSNLQCQFEIEYGKVYTIVLPSADGYSLNHHSVSHTASIPERAISVLYHLESPEIVAINEDGNTFDYETLYAMTQEDRDALGIKAIYISNSVLAEKNCAFVVKYPLQIVNKQWLSQNTELDSNVLPMYSSEAQFHTTGVARCGYDGWWRGDTNTENIIDLAADAGYLDDNNAALYCSKQTLTIGGHTVNGYLGGEGAWQQWRAVREAFYSLYFLLAKTTPTLLTSGNYWSSSQYNAGYAWYLNNGSLNTNTYKAYSYGAVAFFDLPVSKAN